MEANVSWGLEELAGLDDDRLGDKSLDDDVLEEDCMLLSAVGLDKNEVPGSMMRLEVELWADVVIIDGCLELEETSELGISELESSCVLVSAVELDSKRVVERMLEVEI